eukprot:gene8036-8897_t
MSDIDIHNNNTDWDLSAFVSRRQTSLRSSDGMLRPMLSSRRENHFNVETSPNGMDFFNSPTLNDAYTMGEEQFCTRENLDSRLRYLNQEFTVLGFSTIFPTSVVAGRETDAKFDLTKLVNGTYELLKSHNKHLKAKDALEAKHYRSESDNDVLLQSQQRLKDELEQAKREICIIQIREKKCVEQCKILQQERKLEREDMKKMKMDMLHKHKQFNHESKRREKEMLKLKDRVHQLLADKNKERKVGMEIINAIQRTDGKRKMWKTGVKRDEEMYRLIISNYEERHKELITEINLLREYLADVQKELVSLLNEKVTESDDESNNCDDDPKQKLEDGRFHMPFNLVGEDMKNSFRITWQQLKDKIEQNSSKASSPLNDDTSSNTDIKDEEMNNLKQQITNYRAIVTKQEQILQSMQDDKMLNRIESYLKSDVSFTDQEAAKELERSAKEEREKLLKERKLTTELALKLAQERESFEKERTEFYKHCISTPVIAKESSEKGHSHGRQKYQRSTPIFSPAPRSAGYSAGKESHANQMKTPSTAEVYHYMSLAINEDESTDGTYKQLEKETPLKRSNNSHSNIVANNNDSRLTLRTQRVQEHADNVRRVLETLPKRGIEEMPAV